jgi:hypothetical protein
LARVLKEAVLGSKLQSALIFLWLVSQHTVIKAGPSCIRRVQLLFCGLPKGGTTPRLRRHRYEHARPVAVRAVEAIRVEAGKKTSD